MSPKAEMHTLDAHDHDSNVKQLLAHSASITSVADFVGEHQLPCKNVALKGPFEDRYTNLCSASAGAKTLFATDDWFAAADNMLKDTPPLFDIEAYCKQGKVVDGWETQRRREEGHDWCLIELASRTDIVALELNTPAHFTGNHVPKMSIQIADLSSEQLSGLVKQHPNAFERLLHGGVQGTGQTPDKVRQALEACKSVEWKDFLPTTSLWPGYKTTRMHCFAFDQAKVGTIIRVNCFPDGGVARLKLWGESLGVVKPATKPLYMPIETKKVCTVVKCSSTDMLPSCLPYKYEEGSSLELGGEGVACSNKHYGEPWRLLQKTLGVDMGNGWETARHPNQPAILIKDPETHLIDSPLMDWAILKLGKVAEKGVARIIIDTKHFQGNYPESVRLEGCYNPSGSNNDAEWFPLVPRTRMSPDAEHVFDQTQEQLQNSTRVVTHVRLSSYPDGGVSRVRVYG
jgi:allantoicase